MCEACGRNIVLEVPTDAIYAGEATNLRFAGLAEHHLYVADSQVAHGYAVISRVGNALTFHRLDAQDEATAVKACRGAALKDDKPVLLGRIIRVNSVDASPVTVIEGVTTFEAVSKMELLDRALLAVNDLLDDESVSGWVHEEKAKRKRQLDPTKPDDWAQIVAEIQAKVTKVAGKMSDDAIRSMMDGIDIDWTKASEEDVKRFSKQVSSVMRTTATASWEAFYSQLAATVANVLKTTSETIASKYGLSVGASLSLPDLQAAQRLSMDRGVYYFRESMGGPISEKITKIGRDVVKQGIEEGWGKEEIVKKMRERLGKEGDKLTTEYLRMSIDAQVARAREFSALTTMQNGGIELFQIEAVMDAVTCNACRFLHGQVFSVDKALKRYEAANKLDDPRDIKYEMPWVRERVIHGGDHDGKKELFIVQKDGSESRMAVIERSGFGQDDDAGEYSKAASQTDLEAMFVGPPPFHGNCRCTATPVIPDVPGI